MFNWFHEAGEWITSHIVDPIRDLFHTEEVEELEEAARELFEVEEAEEGGEAVGAVEEALQELEDEDSELEDEIEDVRQAIESYEGEEETGGGYMVGSDEVEPWMITEDSLSSDSEYRSEFYFYEDAVDYIETIGAGAVYFGIVESSLGTFEVYYNP